MKVDKTDPQYIKFQYLCKTLYFVKCLLLVAYIDMKGSLPTWIANQAGSHYHDLLKRVVKFHSKQYYRSN